MRLTALLTAAFLAAGLAHAAPPPHHIGHVATPDGVIGYETFGAPTAALPVIVVNGGPGLTHAYMMQNDLWPRVARSRQVVVYDQRGLGASKRLAPGATQSLDADVADLEALRASLKLERIGLVGDSFGGMIAMAYAIAHPDHVARLVLSDSVSPAWKDMVHLLPEAFPDLEAADAAEQKRLGSETDAAARASLRDHFKMIFYSPAKRDAYMARMGDLGFDPAVGAAVSKAVARVDLTAAMKTLPCPTLVITGRYDLNVAPLTAWRMAHEIPHGQFVAFEESGHLPAYEEPERYRTVLETFLDAK